jgi:hypothetical protein
MAARRKMVKNVGFGRRKENYMHLIPHKIAGYYCEILYWPVIPPLVEMYCPVIHLLFLLTSNSIASAYSVSMFSEDTRSVSTWPRAIELKAMLLLRTNYRSVSQCVAREEKPTQLLWL